ncbi:MAG: hypothetical protein KDI55_00300 [Anaerolineae bacterium]|nr:hypothetical protein [Anaerolineae bacterium]
MSTQFPSDTPTAIRNAVDRILEAKWGKRWVDMSPETRGEQRHEMTMVVIAIRSSGATLQWHDGMTLDRTASPQASPASPAPASTPPTDIDMSF